MLTKESIKRKFKAAGFSYPVEHYTTEEHELVLDFSSDYISIDKVKGRLALEGIPKDKIRFAVIVESDERKEN